MLKCLPCMVSFTTTASGGTDACCQVRIGQELVHGQRVQALAAERDRSELLETLRDLQEKLSRSALEARAYAPYSLLHSAILADENVLRNSNDVRPLLALSALILSDST
jgi:hypothetical protein